MSGSRRLVSKGGFSTKAEAEKAMRTAQVAAEQGKQPVRSRAGTVADYLASWLGTLDAAAASGKRKPSTVAHYRNMVDLYLVPTLGDRALARLSPADIAAAYSTLRTRGSKKGTTLSPTTVHHAAVALTRALNAAVTTGLIASSPIDRLTDEQRPPSARKTEKVKAWTPEQADRFAALATADRAGLPLVLALRTGLRRGEVTGLRWRNIKQVERADGRIGGELTVEQTVVMVGGRRTVSTPKANASRRTIPLAPEVYQLLELARRRQAADRLVAGEGWGGLQPNAADAEVFRTAHGAGLHPQSLRQPLSRLAKAAGVPPRSVHGLRHTFATTALVAHRIPVPVVSAWLGHASPSITLDVYAHVLQDTAVDYADMLGATFGTVVASG